MPIPYKPDAPDSQSIRLVIFDSSSSSDGSTATGSAVNIDRWLDYEFASDFLTPSDSFQFTLGVDEEGLPEKQRKALKMGARVNLFLEKNALADSYIDTIEVSADRHSGVRYGIHGRDRLGQTLDTVVDPSFQLKDGGTLADLLIRLFEPFGWAGEDHFVIDNTANRNAKSGIRGTPTNRGGKKGIVKPLKSYVLHQTKPYNHESVFHFASRVAQRHGLWIWVTADGEQLVIGKPDFDQEAIFTLHRGRSGAGNILSGSVRFDMTDQPTMIMADSFTVGGSGEFGKGRSRAHIINPLLGFPDDSVGEPIQEVEDLLKKWPGSVEQELPRASFPFRATNIQFRPMFLHDDESKTQEQINNYVKREMSLLYRKALTAHYVVEGHGQTVDGRFIAWAPDTVVDVIDDVAELREQLYVLGVAFSKSRHSGTTTRLDLVRLNSISF